MERGDVWFIWFIKQNREKVFEKFPDEVQNENGENKMNIRAK